MKKNLIIFFFTIIFCSSANADKLLKNGFINGNMNYAELQEVNDPKIDDPALQHAIKNNFFYRGIRK